MLQSIATAPFRKTRFEGKSRLAKRWKPAQSHLGRFLSPDPIGFRGGINLYGYVGGNPLRYVDPSGLKKSSQGFVGWIVDYANNFNKLSEGLTFEALVQAVKDGEDVLCKNKTIARDVARAAGDGKPPVKAEIHGSGRAGGYRRHFHPHGRVGGHVFFGFLNVLGLLGDLRDIIDIARGNYTDRQPIYVPEIIPPHEQLRPVLTPFGFYWFSGRPLPES